MHIIKNLLKLFFVLCIFQHNTFSFAAIEDNDTYSLEPVEVEFLRKLELLDREAIFKALDKQPELLFVCDQDGDTPLLNIAPVGSSFSRITINIDNSGGRMAIFLSLIQTIIHPWIIYLQTVKRGFPIHF